MGASHEDHTPEYVGGRQVGSRKLHVESICDGRSEDGEPVPFSDLAGVLTKGNGRSASSWPLKRNGRGPHRIQLVIPRAGVDGERVIEALLK